MPFDLHEIYFHEMRQVTGGAMSILNERTGSVLAAQRDVMGIYL